jgi:signal transduction histidine kinase
MIAALFEMPTTAPTQAPAASGVARIADLITHRLSVKAEASIPEVVRLLETHPEADSVAILDGSAVKVVVRHRMFLHLGRRFGYSLYENRPIGLLAEEGSTVEAAADPFEVIHLATQREAGRIYDDILVLEGGRYLGSVSIRSLLVHHKDLLARSMSELSLLDEERRRLEEINRIQSEFVANMTHELRTPLNTMLGIASLILGDEAIGDTHRRSLFLLTARGQELLGIINNMLDLSKLESGAMAPVCEPVDVELLLSELAESAEALASGKPLRVHVNFRSLPRTFPTDPIYLRRIVMNLLSNAVKFTDAGTVTLAAQGEPGQLTVWVEDTGVGIRQEDFPRLFRKFSQLESSRTKRHKGTGLGLAIAKGLVDQLGGGLAVDSHPGVGTTFSVRLPALSPRRHGTGEKPRGRAA